MKQVKNIKELNPSNGDLILFLNLDNPIKVDSEPTVLGTFSEFFINDIGHEVFGFNRGLIFKKPYLENIPIIYPINNVNSINPQIKYGRGFPVNTNQDGFSNRNSVFYSGEENILNALEIQEKTRPYFRATLDFIKFTKNEK